MLHIRCGSDVLSRLRELNIGEAIEWCDPVCQGPTPRTESIGDWYELRGAFLDNAYGPFDVAGRNRLAREDAALALSSGHDETVLWFEADLFDQFVLVALLTRIAEIGAHPARLSLICIGDHPDIPRFIGLGQLGRDQLAALMPSRRPVTIAQLDLARAAWNAVRAPDPTALTDLLAGDFSALPFLPDAVRRHLAELPDVRTGLSRTERMILDAAAHGADRPGPLFAHTQSAEPRPWLGDAMLWAIVDSLCAAPAPLLSHDGPAAWRRDVRANAGMRFRLTTLGGRVRDKSSNWLDHRDLDRWVGGVRLSGNNVWRWDPRRALAVAPD